MIVYINRCHWHSTSSTSHKNCWKIDSWPQTAADGWHTVAASRGHQHLPSSSVRDATNREQQSASSGVTEAGAASS